MHCHFLECGCISQTGTVPPPITATFQAEKSQELKHLKLVEVKRIQQMWQTRIPGIVLSPISPTIVIPEHRIRSQPWILPGVLPDPITKNK